MAKTWALRPELCFSRLTRRFSLACALGLSLAGSAHAVQAGPAVPGPADVVAVDETVGTASILWQKLLSKETTPEAAWQAKEMNADDVIAILNNGDAGDWHNEALARQLVAVLDKYAPERIADPAQQKERARNLIAEYFVSIKDERAVTYYEWMLAQIKTPQTEVAMPVFRLSDYYDVKGDLKKAAETRLREEKYSTDAPAIAGSKVEAARFYKELGDNQKAEELYSQVAKYGYGWSTGIMIYDHASELISQDKFEEARKLLATPVNGLYADQVKVGLLSLTAYSYYREGNWDAAAKTAAGAIDYSKTIGKLLENEGQEAQIERDEKILRWVKVWPHTPIRPVLRALPHVGTISAEYARQIGQPIRITVSVRTFQRVPLEATTDKGGVKTRIEDEPGGGDHEMYFQRQVIMELTPDMLHADFDLRLTVTSTDFPTFKATIPIHVEVPQPKSDKKFSNVPQ